MLYHNDIHKSGCGRFINELTPSQEPVKQAVLDALADHDLIFIRGPKGSGKSNVLRYVWLYTRKEWTRLKVQKLAMTEDIKNEADYVAAVGKAIDSCFADADADADANAAVGVATPLTIDDLFRYYPRVSGGAVNAGRAIQILEDAIHRSATRRTIVTAVDSTDLPETFEFPSGLNVLVCDIPRFDASDYRTLFAHCFGPENVDGIDAEAIYRLAPSMSGFELTMICTFLHADGILYPTTSHVVELLGRSFLKPDVDMAEVTRLLAENRTGLPDKPKEQMQVPAGA